MNRADFKDLQNGATLIAIELAAAYRTYGYGFHFYNLIEVSIIMLCIFGFITIKIGKEERKYVE